MERMKFIVKISIYLMLTFCLAGILLWVIPLRNSCSLEKLVFTDSDIPPGWVIDIRNKSSNARDHISEDGISTTYINNDSKVIILNVDNYLNPTRAMMSISSQIRITDQFYHYYELTTEGKLTGNLYNLRVFCIDNDDFYHIKRCHAYLRDGSIAIYFGSWIDNNVISMAKFEDLVKIIGRRMVECNK